MACIARHRGPSVRARSVAFALASCLYAASAAHAVPPAWNMVWNDEFEGGTVDAAKWEKEVTNTPANNEQQAYVASQVTQSGGNMVITSEKISTNGKPYRSGRVHSIFAQQHGRW